MVQGEFSNICGITLEKTESADEHFVVGYTFEIMGGEADKLRCYIGEGYEDAELNVTLTDTNGNQRVVLGDVEGRYVTFAVSEGDVQFEVIKQPKNYTLEIAAGAGALVIIALIVILVVRKKKKSSEEV